VKRFVPIIAGIIVVAAGSPSYAKVMATASNGQVAMPSISASWLKVNSFTVTGSSNGRVWTIEGGSSTTVTVLYYSSATCSGALTQGNFTNTKSLDWGWQATFDPNGNNAVGSASISNDTKTITCIQPGGSGSAASSGGVSFTTKTALSKGLDRIDQHSLPLDDKYTYTNTGNGVNVYVVDSGIWTQHSEFGGRASLGFDALSSLNLPAGDCYGHGTHVAGTVGGATYGVAPEASLISVRVLDCNGAARSVPYTGGVLRNSLFVGLEWVLNNAVKPAVVNLSFSSGAYPDLDNLIQQISNRGITVVAAAGNNSADACNYSPARATSAITVGGSVYYNDTRYPTSNYGSCVDILAPGYNVTSAYISSTGDTTATLSMNGTSMATPHVSGAAANYLQSHVDADVSEVTNWLTNRATTGIIHEVSSGALSSPSNLLYAGV
jgi:subtilisin family serine protease